MIAMMHFATLLIATMFAIAAAVAFDWMLLRATFHLMRPATARRPAPTNELVHGTRELARAFAAHR